MMRQDAKGGFVCSWPGCEFRDVIQGFVDRHEREVHLRPAPGEGGFVGPWDDTPEPPPHPPRQMRVVLAGACPHCGRTLASIDGAPVEHLITRAEAESLCSPARDTSPVEGEGN